MTDINLQRLVAEGQPPVRKKSDAAKARLKSRYRADSRFKWYGFSALAFTTLFLVILITDIVSKGLPAFWEHSLRLDVPVAADVVTPGGKTDVETLRSADYSALARSALLTAVPGLQSRSEKKTLYDLLSSGATDELRKDISTNSALVGQTVSTRLLLSDNADLYLKGHETSIAQSDVTNGIASVFGTSGEVTILSSANDFTAVVQAVKLDLLNNANKLNTDATLTERSGDAGAKQRASDLRNRAAVLMKLYEGTSEEIAIDSTVPSRVVSINGGVVRVTKIKNSEIKGEALLPLKSADDAAPGTWKIETYGTAESDRNINDRAVAVLEKLKADGKVESGFSWRLFTAGDSREPELAGIRGAIIGSLLTLLVTLGVCLPIGVMAAVYLEEFAPKNRLTDLIEININNLAAVPSIVFGLLGLAVFLNMFGMPRSAPLVGGLVLALLVLPTIIIASRAAMRAVPPSIKEAALGVGASKQQAILHHVLPLAVPGIMTGSIIGMAHALGETAPLLMIGMVAFIVDVPSSITDSATALPVQIFLWSDLPEPAFQAKTAAAIMVLLAVLFVLNGAAIWLRKKFERRW